MDSTGQPRALAQMVRSIGVLALSAPEQIRYIETLGLTNADELALEFSDGLGFIPQFIDNGWLPPSIRPALKGIDRQLGEMSGPDGPWSFDALRGDPRWDTVRQLAAAALREI